MTTLELLTALRRSGVQLWADGDRLGFSAPPQALTPGLRREITSRKAEILAFVRGTSDPAPAAVLKAVAREGNLPLSSGERRLWFLEQFQPGSYAYNVPGRFRLLGAVDPDLLCRSLAEVVQAHEILRTNFILKDGRPIRQISSSRIVPLRVIDLEIEPADRRDEAAERAYLAEARQPFDLAHGALLRALLIRYHAREHALILTLHHAVCDGWSLGVFIKDLESVYDALNRGTAPQLAPRSVQYADYAAWEQAWLQTEEARRQLTYWKERLGGRLPILQIPTDHPRPAMQTFAGENVSMAMPPVLAAALETFCHRHGVTPFMTLLAAFQTLLHRYTGQRDLLVGSPMANRTQPQTEELIGFFVNTLVLRTEIGPELPFRTVVGLVRETTLGAYEHQQLPFEKLVEELQPDRNLAYPPLCQVMFVLQNAPMSPLCLHGVRPARLEYPGGTAKFDLTLFVDRTRDGHCLTAEYNVDLFEQATMTRFLGHFMTLLASALERPDERIGALQLLSSDEQRQLLGWNPTAALNDPAVCVHELFEQQVARTPDCVAVVHGSKSLTYRELNGRANRLARRLRALDVGPNVCVGVCLEPSPLWLVAVLGILKAGGAYVPLDPEYPEARLALMANAVTLGALVTAGAPPEALAVASPVIDIAAWTEAPEDSDNLEGIATPDSLLYVIFTSGSTGGPKGAGVRHRGFVNLLRWFIDDFEIGSTDRVLLASSPSFDLTQKNFFAPLIVGGTLHVPTGGRYDPDGIVDTISREGITLINCTPSAFYPLVERGASRAFTSMRTLRCVFLGGEPIAKTLLRPWIDSPSCGAEVVNTYGPTECTDIVASHRLTAADWESASAVPIGRPIRNTTLLVLDPQGQLVPVGVPGELYVAGDGVGPGYLNDPALTAARFLPHGFAGVHGRRLYRTGDCVRQLGDGAIEFLGRLDHQVKVRGFRVELGEIEQALASHPDIRECAVCAVASTGSGLRANGPEGGPARLIGYVVPRTAGQLVFADVRRFLQSRLPDYMVPGSFLELAALPLTPSGKVDRLALARIEPSAATMPFATYARPQSDLEHQISGLWQRLLGMERVSIHDNFFDLGGHSLLVVQLQSELRSALGRNVSVVDLFRCPTVSSLARHIGAVAPARSTTNDARARAARQREALDRVDSEGAA